MQIINNIKRFFATPVITDYFLDDPAIQLVKKATLPNLPETMKLSVAGFKGQAANLGTLEGQANGAVITMVAGLDYASKYLPLKKWAATNTLKVFPRAGNELNAYYDRANIKFFSFIDKSKRQIFMVESANVVAHEQGHAILDAVRPDFWSVQALEIWAFHEAFSDISAIITSMQFDELLNRALADCGGDLRKTNSLSSLAEQAGQILHDLGATLSYALRDANNNFRYVPPEGLPKESSDNQLSSECHSFGRVFLGAWWNIMVGIYEKEKSNGKDQMTALKTARDAAYAYLAQAVIKTPRVVKYTQAIADMMLQLDMTAGRPYQDVMIAEFLNKGIKSPDVKMMRNICKDDIEGAHDVINFDNGILVPQTKMIKLSKFYKGVSMLANGLDITNIEVEVPADKYFTLDKRGNITEEISSSEEEMAEAAITSVSTIENIGSNEMWDVQNNKLVRKFVI
jgi:hypothetical protein